MIVHASCVALGGRGVLILGGSGAGKSGLALQLMAYGAALVSDDRTILSNRDGALQAAAPDTIRGRIEARAAWGASSCLTGHTDSPGWPGLAVAAGQPAEVEMKPLRPGGAGRTS